MSANDDAWRRPPGHPGNPTPNGPAAAEPSPPAPKPTPHAPPAAPQPAAPHAPPATPGTPQPAAPHAPPQPAPRPEDIAWTRPRAGQAVHTGPAGGPPGEASPNGAGPAIPVVPEYTGPPRSNPPPATWRTPFVVEPPPPGTLPEQDHDRIDVEEQAARTLTTGIGLVVGAICLVFLLVLCARAIF